MGEPDVSRILELPPRLLLGWRRFYGQEPWDLPARAIGAWAMRNRRSVSGDDAEGLEEAFERKFGG